MGSRMAANLLKAGHTLVVHNRTRAKAGDLILAGAGWAKTPADAARDADVLITMLADPTAVAEMAEGPGGIFEGLREGAIWIDCSTVNPSFSLLEAAQAGGLGARFLDAPAAGTTGPAERGELTFLVGGEAEDLEACRPLFEAMGKKIIHAGGHGAGAGFKMLFNMLLGQAMAAFAEALVLGEEMGVDRERLLDILLEAPVVPPAMAGKRSKIEQSDWKADFPLKWMRKDLHLARQTAYEHNVAMPMTAAAEEVFAMGMRQGIGEQDFSAIYRLLKSAPST